MIVMSTIRDTPPRLVGQNQNNPGSYQVRWKGLFGNTTEIAQPLPTHFTPDSLAMSRIDRCWTTLATSVIDKLDVQSSVQGAPETYHKRGLSDHAPTVVSIHPVF